MKNFKSPLESDHEFFTALLKADTQKLNHILTDDFILIDVMRGGEIPKPALLEIIGSGQLKFDSIEPAESRVRLYENAAVVTGRTIMKCRFEENPFTVKSRYTHVYIERNDVWQLASAQGTQTVDG